MRCDKIKQKTKNQKVVETKEKEEACWAFDRVSIADLILKIYGVGQQKKRVLLDHKHVLLLFGIEWSCGGPMDWILDDFDSGSINQPTLLSSFLAQLSCQNKL